MVEEKHTFTVAIPTYNGSDRLPSLLKALLLQQDVTSLDWDVLIVDNNSTDKTAKVVANFQAQYTNKLKIRYAFEKQRGAAFARQRAIQETDSDWIAFVDDDIIPAPNWLAAAYLFSQTHSTAGAYGGRIFGKFEIAPPRNFERISSFLALRDCGDEPRLYEPDHLNLPPSAAWVINRAAWLECVPSQPSLKGRTQGSMVQGDDYEPLMYLHRKGWKIWYNPLMHVDHQIPASRFEWEYLTSISWACGICVCTLRMIGIGRTQSLITFARVSAGSLIRLIAHYLKYGKAARQDLVTVCERRFLLASLLSPLYFLKLSFGTPYGKT